MRFKIGPVAPNNKNNTKSVMFFILNYLFIYFIHKLTNLYLSHSIVFLVFCIFFFRIYVIRKIMIYIQMILNTLTLYVHAQLGMLVTHGEVIARKWRQITLRIYILFKQMIILYIYKIDIMKLLWDWVNLKNNFPINFSSSCFVTNTTSNLWDWH